MREENIIAKISKGILCMRKENRIAKIGQGILCMRENRIAKIE